MTRPRSVYRGCTDYTGVSFDDIYDHLKEWRDSTNKLLQKLAECKSAVTQNKEKINYVDDVNYFIDQSIDLFKRFSSDYDRLLNEIPKGVTNAHIEIIKQILNRSVYHEKYCIQFKRDHIEKGLSDESMRPLLDDIYAQTREEIINYSDLSNVIPRLKTYLGSDAGPTTIGKLLNIYRRMSVMQKLSFWGSVASIIGLVLAFYPFHAQSGNEGGNRATTYGNQSPAIGENKGDININYNNAPIKPSKNYVLRNSKGGAVLIVSNPSTESATDQSKHVCLAVAGTPIVLLGETAKMYGIDMWQKIKITGGQCANKTGWAATENISYE
jgi:hypothetical protein